MNILLELQAERRTFRGGLHWKNVSGHDYLVRTFGRHGGNRSLGARSPETEEAYREFVESKRDLNERIRIDQLRKLRDKRSFASPLE